MISKKSGNSSSKSADTNFNQKPPKRYCGDCKNIMFTGGGALVPP